MPLLGDENMHYRLLKLVDGLNYAKFNVPMFLKRTPILYCVWHPYTCCLALCWRRFYALFTEVRRGRLSAGKVVPTKLICMERVVAVLLHVVHGCKNSLYQKLRILRTVPPPQSSAHKAPLMQTEGVIDLLYSSVPHLLIIACHMRDCRGGSYAHSNMSTVLYSRCLHVLVCLTLGYEHKIEDVHTLMVARYLHHHPWFSRLPGVPFSEDPCGGHDV